MQAQSLEQLMQVNSLQQPPLGPVLAALLASLTPVSAQAPLTQGTPSSASVFDAIEVVQVGPRFLVPWRSGHRLLLEEETCSVPALQRLQLSMQRQERYSRHRGPRSRRR